MPPDATKRAAAEPAEPWRSFLRDLDEELKGSHELHCLGGFVVAQHYAIGRETADIDFLAAIAQSPEDNVEALAGLGSVLHRRYRLYVQRVGVATPPSGYTARLERMFPAARWRRLKLLALDATDLALTKLERNAERDREDVLRLAQAGLLDARLLRERYVNELRPYLLSRLSWHDKTLDLWIEMAWPSK
ncbi:MAG TPA: DUF6036 family nucleotidyltransferase [Steroidobacteraceae bacterium]|nr:DUF6036 family nucleotidyltransferase [Steroidobacteraceae bacterium]